jgi:hypothetical protein
MQMYEEIKKLQQVSLFVMPAKGASNTNRFKKYIKALVRTCLPDRQAPTQV